MNKKDLIAGLWGSTEITISQLKKGFDNTIFQPDISNFLNFCKNHNINYLVWDEIFLKKTRPVPYVLFYKWDINLLDKKIVGIVGPRKINPFIQTALDKFFDFIKDKDVVVVSWLADGTDSYAHMLSLKYGIPTIAILGFWFEKWLKSRYRNLIEKISSNWLVLSEFKLNQEWTKWTFPQRNRIIAWLSDFMFVPQAAEDSGTLITVNKAIEYNIPVYSLFSDYKDEFWKWTNKLISEWKIEWVFDLDVFFSKIADKFGLNSKKLDNSYEEIELSDIEQKIIKLIKKWSNTLELLQNELNLPIEEILNMLSMLELNWLIWVDIDKYFVK